MTKTVIDAKRGAKVSLGEVLTYRDLFWLLALRDYRVRYAQTFLGFAWAFIQPFGTLLIFSVVFGMAAGVDTGGVPYPLFAICGLASWTFFSYVLSNSSNSIIGSQEMIKKIYFPRIIIPLSKAVVGLVDLVIALLFIAILALYYQYIPSPNIVFLPILIFAGILAALSVGIWMSSLTIRFRDLQHVVPFMVQLGLYATPIAYPSSMITDEIPTWAAILFYCNPMAGVVEGFRWSILGSAPPHPYAAISFSLTIVLFITGIYYFRKVERVMADIV